MEQNNGIRRRNLQNECRNWVLRIMRVVEAEVNRGIPQNPTAAARTGARRIEDENLVSTVRVKRVSRVRADVPPELESLSENIDIRGLDDRWRGDNVRRVRLNMSTAREDEESEDYLTTFTFPHNIIVVRHIEDFRSNYSTRSQIIWNSRFSWREIKQYVEDYTYNFDFRAEVIFVGSGQQRLSRNLSQEEKVNNISVAVDGLPSIIISGEESENGDGVVCPICQDPFSSTDPAKQLPCKHLFHSKCIVVWFLRQNSCPTCRRQPALLITNPVVD